MLSINFPSTGSGRPYINLDARTGMWKISTPDGPQITDMTGKTMALDVYGATQGWLRVDASGADWQPISEGKWGAPPSPDHKAGVAITVVIGGTDVRELRGNSRALTGFINAVAREAATAGVKPDGAIPVVKFDQPKLVKIGQGTSVDVRYKMAPADKWAARSVLDSEPAPAPVAPPPAAGEDW